MHFQPIETGAQERPFPFLTGFTPNRSLPGRLTKEYPSHNLAVRPALVLHRRTAVLLRGRDLGVTHQLLLDVDWSFVAAEPTPIIVPKGVPSDVAETILGCKLVTFVMDRNDMALSTFLIHFGACRPGSRTDALLGTVSPGRL
jgi:hypothetical protein